jgi:hypothetical protein
MTFSFYNDQLFKIVIDYDRDRNEGLKDADMIDALLGHLRGDLEGEASRRVAG